MADQARHDKKRNGCHPELVSESPGRRGNILAYNNNYVYKYTRDYVYDNLKEIATGIFLNIDNNLLSACQKAVQSKVLEVCGSLSECDAFDDDTAIGTDSLISYKNSAGDTVIEGLMNIGALTFDDRDPKKPRFHKSGVPNNTNDRIKAAINAIENKAQQTFNVLSTDLTIKRCVEGRDDTWRYQGNETDTSKLPRFPNLLNSYTQMIFNSALNKAYLNYRTKYDELLAKALEDQSDDIKSMLCTAISYNEGSAYCTEYSATENGDPVCTAYGAYGALDDIFNDAIEQNTGTTYSGSMSSGSPRESGSDIGTSGPSNDGLRYIVKGADITKKLQNMSKGKGEFIQTDAEGNMIGKVSMTSFYSASNNTCTITTTNTMCANIQAIITEDTEDCWNGIQVIGNNGNCGGVVNIGGQNTIITQTYNGTMCTDYANPVITTNEIRM